MNGELLGILGGLEREKNIDREVLLKALEAALVSAAKKSSHGYEDVTVRIDRDTGAVQPFANKEVVVEVENPDNQISLAEARKALPDVVEGDRCLVGIRLEGLGRIAAQTARQVIMQKIREAERANVFKDYSGRQGEMVSGEISRFEQSDAILDLGRAEALLPHRERPVREDYRPGDRLRVYILEVRRAESGPQIIVSRSHPELVRRMFELEVPEISDGTVEIKAVARENGERSKIAVTSNRDGVDGVGACVGVRGSRVKMVVRELRGEKIDIVPWSDDAATYITNALSPAGVISVDIYPEEMASEVIVADDQLSLAIGKKGQNVRLAAKMTGWKITIRSESQAAAEERAREALSAGVGELPGAGPKVAAALIEAGVTTVWELLQCTAEQLVSIPGIGEKRAEQLLEGARALGAAFAEKVAAEAAAEAAAAEAAAAEKAAAAAVAAEAAAAEKAAAEAVAAEAAAAEKAAAEAVAAEAAEQASGQAPEQDQEEPQDAASEEPVDEDEQGAGAGPAEEPASQEEAGTDDDAGEDTASGDGGEEKPV